VAYWNEDPRIAMTASDREDCKSIDGIEFNWRPDLGRGKSDSMFKIEISDN
jgi:hypothetical protein